MSSAIMVWLGFFLMLLWTRTSLTVISATASLSGSSGFSSLGTFCTCDVPSNSPEASSSAQTMESDSTAILCFYSFFIWSLFVCGVFFVLFFFDFHLPISELWGQILLNKQQAAKEQVWILDPICLLWATQLTLSPRQSPRAVWKIFLCKDSFQMGEIKPLFNFLHSRVFQEYFSRLHALKLPHRLSWHISEHVAHSLIIILWKHHSDCNTVLILLLTFQ